MQFNDPKNEQNYYLFNVYRGVDDFQRTNMEFICNDPVAEEEELNHGTIKFGVAFSDKAINGKQHRITVTLDGKTLACPFWNDNSPFPSHKTTLYFRLYSITEDYFKYIQTLNLFLKNHKNPLAEPTQVYSNITGGYGIFAGAAVSSDSIVFKY
ncbi:MAG: DUF4249 family protein [Bacteroidetes bacterium]|nr:DUF4249 family protein [Bacteroidota bacterium]